MWLPGLPESRTIEFDSYWKAFLPSFYGGLFSGLLYGAMIGLGIWGIQLWFEARRQRRECEWQLSVLRPKLLSALSKPDIFIASFASQSAPPAATAAKELLESYPLDLWRRELGNVPLLEELGKFQAEYLEFEKAATDLDHHADRVIRYHNYCKQMPHANDEQDRAYFLIHINGGDDNMALQWVHGVTHATLPRFTESLTIVKRDEEVKKLSNIYLAKRKQLNEFVKRLQGFLRSN